MRAVAAFAALLLSSGAALAAPIALDASPDAPARRIVNVVFADYLQQRVGLQVETAAVDLDGDGTGEIVARFVHTESCNEDLSRCRTAIIRYDRRNWTVVFDRAAGPVEFTPQNLGVPGDISVDGVTWKWGARTYEPQMASAGTAISLAEVPAESVPSYAAAFGEGAKRIAGTNWGTKVLYSTDALSQDGQTVVVKMEGRVACGELTGCPVRVLAKKGDVWSTVLATTTKGRLAVADTQRGGYRDLIVQTDQGFAVLGWNGSGYSVADRIEAVKGDL